MPRRPQLLAALAAVLLTFPALASGQAPLRDAAFGSDAGGFGFRELAFEFDVSSGPSGEAPSGSASFSSNVLFASGVFSEISCLSVDGITATFAGPLEPGPPGAAGFGKMLVIDEDPVGIVVAAVYDTPPDCTPDLGDFTGGGRLTIGDVTVVDAQPLPTAKDHCKDGGWRSYGVFKNQGDCVSFVATDVGPTPPRLRGPRNAP